MSKTRKDREGNIRLRADGRWEVRVTIGIDYATGEERRISRYAKTQEEAIKTASRAFLYSRSYTE